MSSSAKPKRRRRTGLGWGLAIAAFSSAAPAQDYIAVDVSWSISQPQRLRLSGDGPAVPIVHDPASGHFVGRYPRNAVAPTFENVSLVGRWNDRDDRLLFLRVSPNIVRLNLDLWRPAYTECRREIIRTLQQPTNDRDAALEAYYRAKALFELDNDSRCLGTRRTDAARAWLDRSFDLARIDCSFRLSPDAARAYFDTAYVARLSGQARAREVGCANLVKNQLWAQGDLRSAYRINLAMIRSLTSDPRLAALVLRWQGLNLDIFKRDGERLAALLGTGGARQPGNFPAATLNLSAGSAN